MPVAVGVIQALGFPGVLAAADAMVKAARVTLVYFDKAESSQFVVAIRGQVSEVKVAVDAGVEAVNNTYGATILMHYIVPNPPENVVAVLPIDYTEASEPFR
ncbi:MAG: BMC domain-containing protein [Hormoscilla sp.]